MPDYVNRGPDPRILEHIPVIGWLSKWLQNALAFHSTNEPAVLGFTFGKQVPPGHVAVQWPPFFTVAIPKANRRYWTFRIGWRWDENWEGGGYFPDVIIKFDMSSPVHPW